MTPIETVLAALRSEREYQRRRWGCRQPDGTLTDAQQSIADYVIYMQDYDRDAQQQATRNADQAASLDALRKVVGLGFACLEQWGTTIKDTACTFDEIAAVAQQADKMAITFDYSAYLLRIGALLNSMMTDAAFGSRLGAVAAIQQILQAGVDCFMQYSIAPRDLSQPIINARDGQPA